MTKYYMQLDFIPFFPYVPKSKTVKWARIGCRKKNFPTIAKFNELAPSGITERFTDARSFRSPFSLLGFSVCFAMRISCSAVVFMRSGAWYVLSIRLPLPRIRRILCRCKCVCRRCLCGWKGHQDHDTVEDDLLPYHDPDMISWNVS